VHRFMTPFCTLSIKLTVFIDVSVKRIRVNQQTSQFFYSLLFGKYINWDFFVTSSRLFFWGEYPLGALWTPPC